MSAIDVVRRKRYVRKSTDTIFVAGRREQNHLGLAARNSQFYPALFCVILLVGQDLESELLGIEGQRLSLIPNRNAHELNRLDHNRPPEKIQRRRQCRCRTRLLKRKIKSL